MLDFDCILLLLAKLILLQCWMAIRNNGHHLAPRPIHDCPQMMQMQMSPMERRDESATN